MGKFKEFKTFIRKKIGLVGVAEFVDDPVQANSKSNWNNWFSNDKYLASYNEPTRMDSYREIIKILDENSVFENKKTVIDAGCGTGYLLYELNKVHSSLKLAGSDFSEEAVAYCKKLLPGADFFLLDVYDVPDNLDKYDVVVCSEVLEHLLYPDKAVEGLKKLLADKGTMVLGVPNGRVDTYTGHINFWSPESWKVFLEMNFSEGYEINTSVFHNNKNNLAIVKKL